MEHKDFVDILRENRDKVWPIIEKNLEKIVNFDKSCQLRKKYQYLVNYHREIYEIYPKRMGKYFRPSMVILTGEAMGVPKELLLNTAGAQQLSEEWILIHDDIEDDSAQRRGEMTLHKMYTKELAINAGDALHVLMWQMLGDNRKIVSDKKTFAIMKEFSKMLNRTVLGQTIEIKWAQENKMDLSDDDVLLIMESKTGYYTIGGPMRLGAIIAGATPKQLEKIYEFGKLTGFCFQIKDDLLDLTSDFAGLKKQIGNDIYEGKRTIMLGHLMRTIKGGDKEKFEKIMKKNRQEKSLDEVRWVIRKMGEYGSLDYADVLMKKNAREAQDFFQKELGFLKNNPARSYLEYLPKFLINRDH